MTAQLTATLKLEGTPKSLDVVASGMKEKPKAELLDAGSKIVVSSMPVVKASAKSYKLRLTCKTTKADIDSGKAAIKKVLTEKISKRYCRQYRSHDPIRREAE